MSDWLPIVAGYGIILGAIAVARLAPHSGVARELQAWYGLAPSGGRGERTRRDHLRTAGIAAAIGGGLLITAFGAVAVADRWPNGSRANPAGMAYMFASVLGAGMALLVAIG